MAQKIDIYEDVTKTLLEAMEQASAGSWRMPWSNAKALPHNGATGRLYNGINVLLLWVAQNTRGFQSPEWFTFKQAKGKGGYVRKGEKGTKVIFWNFIEVPDKNADTATATDTDTTPTKTKTIPMVRTYTVFNRDQIEGLPSSEEAGDQSRGRGRGRGYEEIEDFVRGLEVDIRTGSKAAYVPSSDYVVMPPAQAFRDQEAYYSTLFHELAHWTGHSKRLGRGLETRFGDKEARAMEELVAEMASAFLCAEYGITNETEQHAAYLKSWIQVLRNDKYAIFTASRLAQQAVTYLREETQEGEGVGDSVEEVGAG